MAKYFKVLADATRVRVLELLEEHGELTVGELVGRLQQPQPKVSNHLACLRWCGFRGARAPASKRLSSGGRQARA